MIPDDLLAVSHRYGRDPAFVLAGGGNTSVKSADRLWVKASGHALATIGPDGFVELDRAALDRMLTATDWPADPKPREALFIDRVMAARVHPERGQRPSVEALLHHLLPDRLVVHTHPGVVNAVTCCVDGKRLARELFNGDVLWQPYVDPGLILALALRNALVKRQRLPTAIALQNHGLIVGGRTAAEIETTTGRIVDRTANELELPQSVPADTDRLAVHASALSTVVPHLTVVADQSPAVRWLAGTPEGLKLATAGPLTPDQIVYCRSVPALVEAPAENPSAAEHQWAVAIGEYVRKFGVEPWVGLVAGAGVLAMRTSAGLAEVTRDVYADEASVYRDAAALGGVNSLGPRDRQFIEEWEVEAHRRAVISRPA